MERVGLLKQVHSVDYNMLFLHWPSGEKKLVSDLIFIFEQTDIMEGSVEVLRFCQNVDFQIYIDS